MFLAPALKGKSLGGPQSKGSRAYEWYKAGQEHFRAMPHMHTNVARCAGTGSGLMLAFGNPSTFQPNQAALEPEECMPARISSTRPRGKDHGTSLLLPVCTHRPYYAALWLQTSVRALPGAWGR
jgi:hypothetical protein